MQDREERKRIRRRRRIRNQIFSYSLIAVVAIAMGCGAFWGIKAAAATIRERRLAREESIEAAKEEALAEASAEAESAVAEMLHLTETEETEEESVAYTAEDALMEMIGDCIAGMTLEQKVAGLFFVTPEQLTGVGQVVAAGDSTREALQKYPVGGLIYFKKNIQSEEQLKEMLENTVSYSPFPIFLAVDEEGGRVARVADALGLEDVGPMADIGKAQDPQAAYEANRKIGGYLASYGFNLDFAPVADVLTNPDNDVIGDRSFGSEATLVAQLVGKAVQGLQDSKVSACLKHFPGHGDTVGDSHTGAVETMRTKEEMAAAEFLPFRAGIEAGVDLIMVGHISAPALTNQEKVPACISEDIITDLLRKELGYDGIVITDAMDMEAITQYYEADVAAIMALKAGADMVLMPENFTQAYEGVLKAVADGTISEERINDSLTRIYRVKYRSLVTE